MLYGLLPFQNEKYLLVSLVDETLNHPFAHY